MQQIKSNLIGWIETSRLCLSFNKVSWGHVPVVQAKIHPSKRHTYMEKAKQIIVSCLAIGKESGLVVKTAGVEILEEDEGIKPDFRERL